MSVQAKHRRKSRRGRPHEQFTIAIAILSLVMAGGMVAGLATSTVAPAGEGTAAAAQSMSGEPSNTTRMVHRDRITGDITP